jgi:hypothetical protein
MADTMFDMSNAVSTEDLRKLLVLQVKKLMEDPGLARKLPPLMVWGAPGIGKSSIMRGVAEELGIGFIDVRLAQREPVDIRGLPVPDKESKSVAWYVSDEWPRDPASKGIILFDEITAADRSLQVAAYELILDRRLGDLYAMPDGWYVCAAGNRVEDAAVAMTMSSALANRFLHVELREDPDLWTKWALRNGVDPAVIGFIRYRPSLLFRHEGENLERGWPSPRSWDRVSAMLGVVGEDETLLARVVNGLVGNAAGTEFLAFRKVMQEMDDVRELMLDPGMEVKIPAQADRRYAMCSAAAAYVWSGKDADEQRRLLDGFFRIAIALPGDFSAMLMADAMRSDDENGTDTRRMQALFEHPSFKEWTDKHGLAMRKRMKGVPAGKGGKGKK